MIKRFLTTLKKDPFLVGAIVLFLIGTFLRFYRLPDFVTFLGDQGRDAIVIKRILTGEHFPAIGPPTSVGQIYLGPFYYYFIAPWLLITEFDPIGLAIGVAVFSSLFILINYFIVKELLGKPTAFLSTIFLTFSYTLIDFSKFSWNPNLLPLFTLLAVYFFIKAFKSNKSIFFVLGGAFLSFSVQLHYLAIFLIPALLFYVVTEFLKNKKQIKIYLLKLFYSGLSFLFFSVPLLIFDLRHNFQNSKSFLALSQTTENISGNKLTGIFNSFFFLNKYVFNIELNQFIVFIFILFIIISFILALKRDDNIKNIMIFFVISLLGISLYAGPKFPHYFGIIYPFYIIFIAYFLSFLKSNFLGKLLLVAFLTSFVFLNSKNYYYFYNQGSRQIELAKSVAQLIPDNFTNQKYAFAAIPEYSDYTYRYFLEIWDKKPINRDSRETTEELYVVCEQPCKPIGDPQWTIAYFAPTKIVGEWTVRNIKIYKLTH